MTYETVGKDVICTFELFDHRSDLVAYFWNYTNGFSEAAMSSSGNNKFTYTLPNQTIGSKITFAAKFAFAGGMAVTQQIQYIVGTSCGSTSNNDAPLLNPECLYPNPVSDVLHFRLPYPNNRIQLWNVSGQQVWEQTIPALYSLDMSSFANGAYIIRISNEYEQYAGKVIVRK